MSLRFDLQGHRGARDLRPENTLCSFEAALDYCVTSIETDVHLTADAVPVLVHDPIIGKPIFTFSAGFRAPDPARPLLVSQLTLEQLRTITADGNPDRSRFPDQKAGATPVALAFAQKAGIHPNTPPTLADLFGFTQAYAGTMGERAGKTQRQRSRAASVYFDLELKRVPFHPVVIGDGFAGDAPALFEERVVDAVRSAGMLERTIVRSFDHRCVRAVKRLEPSLITAVVATGTAFISVPSIVRAAAADIYCPDYMFLDPSIVAQAHLAGIRVLPWTVNTPADWDKLVAWGVDGITTDFPGRLAQWLEGRGIDF
jgi:glycerophosphoryl diester phosphodiesterase